ncbi:MAG: transglycosylase SLT domain-containing protein [Calditrichia bacterium]
MFRISIRGMLLGCIVLTFIVSCTPEKDVENTVEVATGIQPDTLTYEEIAVPQVERDLPQIRERGKLLALTGYNSNSYFIYKGEPLGFEYELLKLLAEHLELELEVVIVKNLDQIFSYLNAGQGDIIAYNMSVTKERLQKVGFTNHHSLIRQVLVQKLPDNWRDMKIHEINRMLVTNPIDLIGKKIHVRKGSSYYHRLQNLSDEIGGDIDIVEASGEISTESLIAQVAKGEIDYTVADQNLALVNAAYYQNIDIRTFVSFSQRIAWAVRENSPELKSEIDSWLKKIKREPTYNLIYDKYYKNKRFFKQRVRSEYFTLTGGKISEYDDVIREQAATLNWDWRLLASQIYQESEFDPEATSWVGAKGLMQLMPATARMFKAGNLSDPNENIAAGVRYLKWLNKYWDEIPDSTERLKFILASYNTGQGHVQDARNLTVKYKKDPNIWTDNVEEFVLKKAQERYFNDEVVKYGYCRGEEPVGYVIEILERFNDYQKLVVDDQVLR